MWIFGLDKKSRDLKKAEWDKEYAEAQAKADEQLRVKTESMLGSYCAILKSNCKGVDCIHFNSGYARVDVILSDRPRADVWYPRCKLWR